MYDRFGEFDSWEELNSAAQGQKEEGDEESLLILAKENGIDKEDAEDFLNLVLGHFKSSLPECSKMATRRNFKVKTTFKLTRSK